MKRSSNPIDRINAEVYHSEGVEKVYNSRWQLRQAETVVLLKYHHAYAGKDMLDIGVGAGRTSVYLAPLCRTYLGIDYSPVMVREMHATMPHVEVSLKDMRDLHDLADASLDFVFAADNVFDAVDQADRLTILAECHRVLREGALLAFSGHSLDCHDAGYPPAMEWRRNPISQLKEVASWLRRRRNYGRLQPFCHVDSDHAIFCDDGHDFTLLHYYIGQQAQRKQLEAVGFDVVEVLDNSGHEVPAGELRKDSPGLMYVARRRETA